MMIDSKARYMPSHEWAKQYGSENFTIGLSRYAVEQLGEIVYVKLPEVGREVTKSQPFATIESVKTTVDLTAPLTGTVTAVNTAVPDNPETLHKDAYEMGWLIKICSSAPAEFETLMDASAYRTFLETEG